MLSLFPSVHRSIDSLATRLFYVSQKVFRRQNENKNSRSTFKLETSKKRRGEQERMAEEGEEEERRDGARPSFSTASAAQATSCSAHLYTTNTLRPQTNDLSGSTPRPQHKALQLTASVYQRQSSRVTLLPGHACSHPTYVQSLESCR